MTMSSAARLALVAILVFAASAAINGAASATSASVRSACMSDYFSYCSAHAVGSASLRTCMRSNGPRLSSRCVSALVAAGEISQGYVSKRRAIAGAD